MRNGMKERIIGGAILVALAIIVVPMFFGGSGKKDGSGQAPSMTINEEQIDVPDDQQQASNSDGNEGQQPQGDGAGADVSQYSQLLPGSEGPQDISPDAQTSVTQAQQGSNSNTSSASGESSAAASQSHQMETPQPVHESSAQPQQQPATTPQRPAHREPAHSQPASEPQRSGNSSRNSNASTSTASNTPPKSASQASSAQRNSGSSMASSDPILAAANRYDSNGSRSSSSGASASGRWSVQAGSFGNVANADNLVKRLKGLGFNAYQISRGANKVVLVGPYNSSGAGESARTQLQQKANINGFVVHSGGNAG